MAEVQQANYIQELKALFKGAHEPEFMKSTNNSRALLIESLNLRKSQGFWHSRQ